MTQLTRRCRWRIVPARRRSCARSCVRPNRKRIPRPLGSGPRWCCRERRHSIAARGAAVRLHPAGAQSGSGDASNAASFRHFAKRVRDDTPVVWRRPSPWVLDGFPLGAYRLTPVVPPECPARLPVRTVAGADRRRCGAPEGFRSLPNEFPCAGVVRTGPGEDKCFDRAVARSALSPEDDRHEPVLS
jgi:hypothetical protein